MLEIVSIVEGQGEVESIPILLRRIAADVAPGVMLRIPRPIRVPRQRIVKSGELERIVQIAAKTHGTAARILILLDADDDCPATLGPELLQRATATRPDRTVRVVLANSEYETWFLASSRSLAERYFLSTDIVRPNDPESIRDAKRWLSKRMPSSRSYKPPRDQPELTRIFDLHATRSAPSFDKFWRDVSELLLASNESSNAGMQAIR